MPDQMPQLGLMPIMQQPQNQQPQIQQMQAQMPQMQQPQMMPQIVCCPLLLNMQCPLCSLNMQLWGRGWHPIHI